MLTLVKLIDVVYLVGRGGGEEVGGCGEGGGALVGQPHQLGHLLGHHLSAISKTKNVLRI